MPNLERVILLIDLDCFYCQVEEHLHPRLKGKPLAVLQYNVWREGGIIAANYAARKFGVNKGMWRAEAERRCPGIQFASVPELRGKADLTRYREAGKKVAEVLRTFTTFLERASVDEAYLDITDLVEKHINSSCVEITSYDISNTYIFGYDTSEYLTYIYENKEISFVDLKLVVGALICEQIRAKVFSETGYECSAGIAHNKLLAKLASSIHKPNKQTVLPESSIGEFLKDFPIKKMKNLGGKFGNILSEEFSISVIGELAKYTEKELITKFDEKNGKWLYNVARGIDQTPVNPHFMTNSIACSKRFPGKHSLKSPDEIEHWIKEIALDLSERLQKDIEENNRKGTQMTVLFSNEIDKKEYSNSKTIPLMSYDFNKIAQKATDTIKSILMKYSSISIKLLSINVSNFESKKNINNIKLLFDSMNNSKLNKPSGENLNSNNIISKLEGLSDEKHQYMGDTLATIVQSDATEVKFKNNNSENKNEATKYTKVVVVENNTTAKVCLENKVESGNVNKFNNGDARTQYSFFKKYFEERAKKQSKTISIGNDVTLNTIKCDIEFHSKAHEEDVLEEPEGENNSELEGTETLNVTDNVVLDGHKSCPECNEKVLESEYFVHMDYHYALRLNLQNIDTNENDSPKSSELNNKNSNKSKESVNPLDSFLEKEQLSQETELCTQCNKKIKLQDLDNHNDYHTAKRLHSEINTVNKQSQTTRKTKRSKNNLNNITKISAFFKPV